MSIGKNGIWKQGNFIEAGAYEIYSPQEITYTPTKDTQNSCNNVWTIDFRDWIEENKSLTIRVEVDAEYSGFDSSSTAGTFAMRWQGASYSIDSSSWVWTTGSPVATALNNQQGLTTLVNGNNGSYHYNNTYTIPYSWFTQYNQTRLQVRTDYSNGTGIFTMKNLKVYLEKNYGADKVKITSENTLAANDFIEI